MKDGQDVTSSSTLTLTVNGANDAPTVVADTGTVGENATDSFAVLANDSDLDTGDSLTLSTLGSVAVTSTNLAVNGIDATAVFTIDGNEIKFTPGNLFDALAVGETATVVVGYTVKDTLDAASSSTLTAHRHRRQRCTDRGRRYGLDRRERSARFVRRRRQRRRSRRQRYLDASDPRQVTVSSPNGDINGINASTAFSILNGEIAFNPGTLFDALDHDDTATVVVNYTMKDGQGVTSSSTLTLTVNGANDVAVIGGASAASVTEDVALVGGNLTASGTLTRCRPRPGRGDLRRPSPPSLRLSAASPSTPADTGPTPSTTRSPRSRASASARRRPLHSPPCRRTEPPASWSRSPFRAATMHRPR